MMKLLFSVLIVLLPSLALAQTAPIKPLHPENVQIIDGKKFFSLATARRQQSTALSPSALAVLNNPRSDTRLPQTERLAMTPVTRFAPAPTNNLLPWQKPATPATGTTALPAITSPAASASPPTGADAQKAALLSIFAPDDKPAR